MIQLVAFLLEAFDSLIVLAADHDKRFTRFFQIAENKRSWRRFFGDDALPPGRFPRCTGRGYLVINRPGDNRHIKPSQLVRLFVA